MLRIPKSIERLKSPSTFELTRAEVQANCDRIGVPMPYHLFHMYRESNNKNLGLSARPLSIANVASINVENSRLGRCLFQSDLHRTVSRFSGIATGVSSLGNVSGFFVAVVGSNSNAKIRTLLDIDDRTNGMALSLWENNTEIQFSTAVSSSRTHTSFSSATYSQGDLFIVGFSHDGSSTTSRIITNIGEVENTSSGGSPATSADAYLWGSDYGGTNSSWIAHSTNDQTMWSGPIYLAALWTSKTLAADQLRSLIHDPFALIRQTPRRIFFDVGAAAADLTANLVDTNAPNWFDTRAGTLTYAATVADDVNT